jgi:kynurenine formamidase
MPAQDGEPVVRRTELVDLSVPLTSAMPVYPGDPEVVVSPALTAAGDGVNVLRIHLGSQSGTHVDAPFHIDGALPTLDELPLGRFTGPTAVVDARRHGPRSPVGPEAIPPELPPGVVVLFATGWSAHWGGGEYLRHPYLARETAEALVEAGVRTVGIDAPSIDPTPAHGEESKLVDNLAAHRVLCRAGAVIVENLTGLATLLAAQEEGRPIETFLFPLPVAGADGAPVRAVARLG